MTKRKNAGAGYGYMFHGAFKEKKDAVAKERKTKGAWIKPTLTNSGYRYIVMSPRVNPIKRKKKVTPEEARAYLLYDHAREWANAAGEGARRKIAKKAEQMRKLAGRENPAARNPHELLIMGANPSEIDRENTQEISLPPGATIVIRTPRQNPENPDRYTSKHAELSGARYTPPALIQTKRQKRVAKMVRGARRHKYDWIPSEGIAPGQNPGDDSFVYAALGELYPGKILNELSTQELSKVLQRAAVLKHQPRQNITGLELAQIAGGIGGVVPLLRQRKRKNVELGTYENGVFHPWTRRPKSRQKKAIRRQNSSAATIREDFTGAPSEYVTSANEPHMPAGDYAQLGELLALYVKPVKGGQVMQIDFKRPRPKVVSDESARQIWFFEGDQDVTDSLASFGAHDRGAGLFELGEARRIDYKQRKEHVPDPDVDEWRHEFGEETGVRPTVLFDRNRKRLMLEGGEYEIRREGIVN
jgi:hypothetical protein